MDYLIPKKLNSGEDIILEDWQVSPVGNKSKTYSFWNLTTIITGIITVVVDSTYLATWFTGYFPTYFSTYFATYFPTYYAANRSYFPTTVYRTNTDVSTSTAATDVITHTIALAAGTVGATDLVEITNLNYKTGTAGAMTVKWWLSTSASSVSGAIQIAQLSMTATTRNGSMERHLVLKAINSQRIYPVTTSANSDITSTTTATVLVAADFLVNQWLHVTVNMANAADVGTSSCTQVQIMKQ